MRGFIFLPRKVVKSVPSVRFLFVNPLFVYSRVVQGGSNMTGTDLYVNKPHCAAAVLP